jgi:hypothetical protein
MSFQMDSVSEEQEMDGSSSEGEAADEKAANPYSYKNQNYVNTK